MSIKTLSNVFLLVLCLVIFKPAVKAETRETDQTILVSLQKRLPSEVEEGAFIIVNEMQVLRYSLFAEGHLSPKNWL